MRIKLTQKIASYASENLRARFDPRCIWLGTVVDDHDRRGALMQSPTGAYNLVRSYNKVYRLDTDAVTLALVDAMAPDAPKGPRGRPRKPPMPAIPGAPVPRIGRPPQHGERMRPCMVALPASVIEDAKRIGKGNISAGVRAMLGVLHADH